MFEKKYRVISNDTGPGFGWTHRFRLTALWQAIWFERIEKLAGIKSNGWDVEKRRD